MDFTILNVVFVIIFTIFYASAFEWVLHKYVMHDKPFGFSYAYKAHHQVHHVLFGAGKTYIIQNHKPENMVKDMKKIPMAWWNWIVLLIIVSIPVAVIILSFLKDWWILAVVDFVFLFYYLAYEYFHWCMHDPEGRWFENTFWFKFLNNHHKLHHKYVGSNLNVVLPIADLMFRTLRTKVM